MGLLAECSAEDADLGQVDCSDKCSRNIRSIRDGALELIPICIVAFLAESTPSEKPPREEQCLIDPQKEVINEPGVQVQKQMKHALCQMSSAAVLRP